MLKLFIMAQVGISLLTTVFESMVCLFIRFTSINKYWVIKSIVPFSLWFCINLSSAAILLEAL